MSAVMTEAPRAKKDYRCERCLGEIKAGRRYRLYKIPPGGEFGYAKWIRGREHLTEAECWPELAS